jgi:hypothetical protein
VYMLLGPLVEYDVPIAVSNDDESYSIGRDWLKADCGWGSALVWRLSKSSLASAAGSFTLRCLDKSIAPWSLQMSYKHRL